MSVNCIVYFYTKNSLERCVDIYSLQQDIQIIDRLDSTTYY